MAQVLVGPPDRWRCHCAVRVGICPYVATDGTGGLTVTVGCATAELLQDLAHADPSSVPGNDQSGQEHTITLASPNSGQRLEPEITRSQ